MFGLGGAVCMRLLRVGVARCSHSYSRPVREEWGERCPQLIRRALTLKYVDVFVWVWICSSVQHASAVFGTTYGTAFKTQGG